MLTKHLKHYCRLLCVIIVCASCSYDDNLLDLTILAESPITKGLSKPATNCFPAYLFSYDEADYIVFSKTGQFTTSPFCLRSSMVPEQFADFVIAPQLWFAIEIFPENMSVSSSGNKIKINKKNVQGKIDFQLGRGCLLVNNPQVVSLSVSGEIEKQDALDGCNYLGDHYTGYLEIKIKMADKKTYIFVYEDRYDSNVP